MQYLCNDFEIFIFFRGVLDEGFMVCEQRHGLCCYLASCDRGCDSGRFWYNLLSISPAVRLETLETLTRISYPSAVGVGNTSYAHLVTKSALSMA